MAAKGNWISAGLALAVAGAIALAAFVAGQVADGSGMIVAIAASGLWVAYSVARQRRHQRGA